MSHMPFATDVEPTAHMPVVAADPDDVVYKRQHVQQRDQHDIGRHEIGRARSGMPVQTIQAIPAAMNSEPTIWNIFFASCSETARDRMDNVPTAGVVQPQPVSMPSK